MRKSVIFALGFCIFAITLGVGLYVTHEDEADAIEFGRLVEPARPLEQFTLMSTDGRVVHKEDFLGVWTVLTFGFTHCPDVCPASLAFFKNELEIVNTDREEIQFAFISVDPERDTLDKLQSYVEYFHPKIKAFTGTEEELKKLTGMLGSYFVKEPSKDGKTYSVSHSPYFFLINPQGEWQAFYSMPLGRGKLATDLTRLAAQGKSLF